jgi:hypothetical protein
MDVILIAGKGGVGKLTIASEVSRLTRFRLFHNHLTANIVLSLFDLYSEHFAGLREDIWRSAILRSIDAGTSGLVITFSLDPRLSEEFLGELWDRVRDAGGRVFVVRITCAEDEHRRRTESPGRSTYGKSTEYEQIVAFHAGSGVMPDEILQPDLVVDTTDLSPAQSAATILEKFRNP